MTQAIYRHKGCAIDYTPAGALTGGDVVVQQALVGVTPVDLAANEQGALQITDVHGFDKAASVTFAVDDPVYWDDSANKATDVASGNAYIGPCTKAAASGDATVEAKIDPKSVGDRSLLYAAVAASTAVSNTTTETAFTSAYSIPANTLKVGDVLKVRLQAIATATNSTDTLDVQLRLGTTDVIATGAVDVANDGIAIIDADIVIRTVGASGTFVAAGWSCIGVAGTATAKAAYKASTAIDTTAAISVNASATWSVANAGNSCRLDVMNVQLLRR